MVGVGVDRARDERSPRAAHGRDDRDAAPPRHGVGAEGNAGRLGGDHALHEHRRDMRRIVEPMLAPIGSHARRQAGAPDGGDAPRDIRRDHVQVRVELSGERVGRSVLVGRGGAHRDGLAARAEDGQRVIQLRAYSCARVGFRSGLMCGGNRARVEWRLHRQDAGSAGRGRDDEERRHGEPGPL